MTNLFNPRRPKVFGLTSGGGGGGVEYPPLLTINNKFNRNEILTVAIYDSEGLSEEFLFIWLLYCLHCHLDNFLQT